MKRSILLWCCLLPLDCYADVLSVAQFRQLAPTSGEHEISGYIAKRYRCPLCPAGAVCKPCMGNNVLVSQANELHTSYPSAGEFLVVFTDAPERLSIGKKYSLTVEVLESQTTGYGVRDLKLKSAAEGL